MGVLERFFAIVAMTLMLVGCGKAKGMDNMSDPGWDAVGLLPGASGVTHDYALTDNGVYYVRDHRIKYYDFGTAEDYVFCGDASCRHDGRECMAYVGNDSRIRGLVGMGHKAYYFEDVLDAHILYRLDIDRGERKEVGRVSLGGYKANSWRVTRLGNAVYSRGSLWLVVDYQFLGDGMDEDERRTSALVKIDVSDGGRNVCGPDPFEGDQELVMQAFDDEGVLLKRRLRGSNEADFVYARGDGSYEIWEPGVPDMRYDNSLCLGLFDGRLYFSKFSNSHEEEIFCYSPESGLTEKILDIVEGGSIGIRDVADFSTAVTDGGHIIYLLFDGKAARVYDYDINDGESRFLYDDVRTVEYRLVGENRDSFVMRRASRWDEPELYRISKADYYSGKIGSAELCRTR